MLRRARSARHTRTVPAAATASRTASAAPATRVTPEQHASLTSSRPASRTTSARPARSAAAWQTGPTTPKISARRPPCERVRLHFGARRGGVRSVREEHRDLGVCVCVCVCVHHQRPHSQIKYIYLFVVCFQIIFKFVVDITAKKTARSAFFLDSVTVNTVLHKESEACQKNSAKSESAQREQG